MYCKGFVAITTHNIYNTPQSVVIFGEKKELKINGKRVLCTAKQIFSRKMMFFLLNRFEISTIQRLYLRVCVCVCFSIRFIYLICYRFLAMLFQNFYSLILLIRLDTFRLKMVRLTTSRTLSSNTCNVSRVFINIWIFHKCFFVALGTVK